ncbi:MAG: protein kinase domain-containing protein [Thermoanaerobaculia bacterium]
MLKLSLPARLVPPLAALKLALGLIAFFVTYDLGAGRDPAFPYFYFLLFMTAFGATGALLVLGGRRDRRALALGGFFLAAATAWANRPLRLLADSGRGFGFLALIDALELDAFLPYFLWVFVREFPSPLPTLPGRRRLQLAVRVSALLGLLFFGLNLAAFVLGPFPRLSGRLAAFLLADPDKSLYYPVVTALIGFAFLLLPWKAHQAQGIEKRRARVFLQILTLTFMPMVVFLLLDVFLAPFRQAVHARPEVLLAWVTAVLLPALLLPVSVPYAVLVHRVLDVRLIARRALQHALARSMALVLVAGPVAALAVYMWARREERISLVFTGPRVPLLISVILIGAAAFHYRKTLIDAIDRRFFREQYDARQILTRLAERIRTVHDSPTLADLVTREIELALHLEKTALLAVDSHSGVIVDPRGRLRKLDASSHLALTASNASAPLEVDFEDPNSPFRRLPEKERQWLEETGFRLLVPILARDGSLLGLIGLGEKRSGLPFLREDRQLLHAIASNAAWVLELEHDRSYPSTRDSWKDRLLEPDDPTPRELPAPPPAEPAKECPKCGALHPSYTVFCGTCSRRLETSAVPYVLPGKFRFERRIGVGGMGVVYSGSDLALGRRVALKTLRHVSPEDATRLRREARTAAAVSHPHLAPIYGLETWKGTPLLVLELLEGGTLAQRIIHGPLSPRETVDLGIAMSGALGQLHQADILHRDIKPSNIGYTRDGVPKLMDFGIARFLFEPAPEEDLEELEPGEDEAGAIPPHHRFAGTLSYLAPEALRGATADESFDLWSLGIVLFECLLGRKIFTGPPQQVIARIRAVGVPDFSQVCPEHEGPLGDFFREALHRSTAHRPATAEEMRERLEAVREAL